MVNFDPGLLLPYFRLPPYRSVAITVAALEVIPTNAQRVAFMASISTGATINITPFTPGSSPSVGWPITSSLPLLLTFADVGPLVGANWWTQSMAGGTLWIQEIIYVPGGSK